MREVYIRIAFPLNGMTVEAEFDGKGGELAKNHDAKRCGMYMSKAGKKRARSARSLAGAFCAEKGSSETNGDE